MALKNAQTGRDSSMSLCQINNYIGITLFRLNGKRKGDQLLPGCLKVAKRLNDNDAVLQIMSNIVQSYTALKKSLEEALTFMKSLPKNTWSRGWRKVIFMRLCRIVIIYNEMKNYALVAGAMPKNTSAH